MPDRVFVLPVAVALAVALSGCPPQARCAPTSCAEAGIECGQILNSCGKVLDCGECRAPLTCGGGGTPNFCGCTPASCAQRGADCGVIADGCDGTLDCGACAAPLTCGGGGQDNVCGCTPTSCSAAGATCGSIPDDCGRTLDCGACVAPQTCAGGGTPNVCGCTPTTCAAQGATCGVIPDGCGHTIDCGSCAPQCGNARLEAGEECDDGNTVSGDSCSATCQIEPPCQPVPAAPTTGLTPGTATGSLTLNTPDGPTRTWITAAFVPVSGTTKFQLIVSDDPQLCDTLVNTNQYQSTPCNDSCSLCPGCFGASNGHAYLTAYFEQSLPAGSYVDRLSYFDGTANVVGWGIRMNVDDAPSPSSTALTGQLQVCNAKYKAYGMGRLHATLCPGGLPIYH